MKTLAYLVLFGKEYPMVEHMGGWVAIDGEKMIAQSPEVGLPGVLLVEHEFKNKGLFTEDQVKKSITLARSGFTDDEIMDLILPRLPVHMKIGN